MVKLALVGAGYWGKNWYRTICDAWKAGYRNAELIFVVDSNPDMLFDLERSPNGTIRTCVLDTLLSDPFVSDFDAAIVATPASSHVPVVLELLERGKHVLVEKPPALSIKGLTRLCHARKDLVLMVGLTYLHHPAVSWLAQQIGDEIEAFGEPLYVRCRWTNDGIVRDDVDVIWNVMPHPLSILLSLFGDNREVRVTGYDRRAFLKKGRNDWAMVQLDIGGCQASIEVSWLDMKKRRDVWIQGEHMAVWFDEIGRNVEVYRGNMPAVSMNWSPGQGLSPLEVELRRFVGAIENGLDCVTPIYSPVVSDMMYLLAQIGEEKWEVWNG